MAVDVGDLIESLKREVSPPGTDLYPNAEDDEWFGHLQDAFWEARLHGMLEDYTMDENGQITPFTGTTDMTRDLQQLIVLYAGFRITLTQFQNLKSLFRAKAGPVEFETQQQGGVLKEILAAIRARINIVINRLSDVGESNAVIFDAVIERSYSIAAGDTWFVR